jgi:hypothetical protein
MAENTALEPSFNFSIQDNIPGSGNAELLNDLIGAETSTASPNDVTPISKEEEPSKKTTTPPEPVKEDKKSISDFLAEGTEDEEEEVIKEDKKSSKVTSIKEEEPSGQFGALTNDLVKLGVFSKEEGEELNINTPEEFLGKFQAEKQKGAQEIIQNFLGQFGEDYQKAFQAIYVNGADPKDYFTTYNNIVNFADLDLSKESNQERVIRQALADQEFDAEDIDSEIERLKNYGDLETVATKHHKVLVKKEASKLQQIEKQAQVEQEQKRSYKAQYIQNVATVLQEKVKAKEFDGIPINPKLAEELQDFLITDKYRLPSGETITDFDKMILDLKHPQNHSLKVKVGLVLKMLEKDPTLSSIQKAGISKKTDSLFSETVRHTSKTPTKVDQPTSWFQ